MNPPHITWTEFAEKYPDWFAESLRDAIYEQETTIADFLADQDAIGFMTFLENRMSAAKQEAAEEDASPVHDDEKLDDPRHGQAEPLNAETSIFLRRQAD